MKNQTGDNYQRRYEGTTGILDWFLLLFGNRGSVRKKYYWVSVLIPVLGRYVEILVLKIFVYLFYISTVIVLTAYVPEYKSLSIAY